MSLDPDKAVYDLTPMGRIIVLFGVVLASTCYTATILVATTLLPQMQGGLSATQDEISWVMTFNIIATAVATPMTGWLVGRFGRRITMMACLAGFTFATFMCGSSTSLEALVFWRIMQGGLGAPLVPMSQTLLLDSYPRRQHAFVMSLYGMSNILGPVIGPTLGGYIGEQMGWPWGFYMVLPVSIFAFFLFRSYLPADQNDSRPVGLDWIGFLSLSAAIAGCQLVLSRGQRLDWFDSNEILIEAVIAVVAFYVFLSHSLTTKNTFLNLGHFRDRNYAIGCVLVTLYGMLNFAPIVLMPPLLQQHAGFPDSAIGTYVAWRGVGNGSGFFAAMFMQRLDPRVAMIIATLIQTTSGWWIAHLNLDVSQTTLAINSLMQGFSVGVFWVPLTVVTFSTLAPEFRAEGSSVFHLLRNLGSSLFISIAVTEIVRTTGANYSRMTELATAYNKAWQLPWVTGAWTTDTLAGIARISREITRQATMIGFTNAFVLYTLLSATAIPLCLLIRPPRRG
ncbi:MAG: DHA2 family efflux MFS transporter permease subunit [Proteobacteria bacterium]|nr:DHA2 family efflux MFS transporter permease subunit [Pseudomonadota bacterium]